MIEGKDVQPKNGEDHVAHLTQHIAFAQTEHFSTLEKEVQDRIIDHMRITDVLAQQEAEQAVRLENAQALYLANSQIAPAGGGEQQ